MRQRMIALWTLGTAFFKQLAIAPFVRARGGREWLARLKEERLAPTPPDVWPRLAAAGRCIGCGLCDAAVLSGSPWATIWGAARQPEDAPLAVDEARALLAAAQDVARVCPARLRADEVGRVILANAAQLVQL